MQFHYIDVLFASYFKLYIRAIDSSFLPSISLNIFVDVYIDKMNAAAEAIQLFEMEFHLLQIHKTKMQSQKMNI